MSKTGNIGDEKREESDTIEDPRSEMCHEWAKSQLL